MKKNFWFVTHQIFALLVLLFAVTFLSFFFVGSRLFVIEFTIALIAFAAVLWRNVRVKRDLKQTLEVLSERMGGRDAEALGSFPVPALAVTSLGEVIYYNDLFRKDILSGAEAVGANAYKMFSGFSLPDKSSEILNAEVKYNKKIYNMCVSEISDSKAADYLILLYDVTELRNTEEEYISSRPVILTVLFDNREELLKVAKDSEVLKINTAVQELVENWISDSTGLMKTVESGKYIIITEERYLKQMIDKKFSILNEARKIKVDDRNFVTLSIGVGRGGKDFKECEIWSAQALDMVLGRGGDQAAIKSSNGYVFFGGISKTVEKRSRVRMRTVASSMSELISRSSNVLIMGHRNSDLDAVGSAIGMYGLCKSLGKTTKIVIDPQTSLANQIIDFYSETAGKNVFIKPENALSLIDSKTLLIIVDCHTANMTESPAVYNDCEHVIVIDHHRKMVEFIDNSLIFCLEPYASSACEIVSEIIQYVNESSIGRQEAEALLSGIILDTKNFILNTGVRTFEAAAFLRRKGADTMEVKRMFSESIECYLQKTSIVSQAEIFKNSAISCVTEPCDNIRVTAAKAADDMLSFTSVDASYVIFSCDGNINVSARSLGRVNVQIIMEALGGGGHQAMAAAQLKGTSIKQVYEDVKNLITENFQDQYS